MAVTCLESSVMREIIDPTGGRSIVLMVLEPVYYFSLARVFAAIFSAMVNANPGYPKR
jgi:hypothetical protein